MSCYRDGGCGPYEMYSCNECQASKPEYKNRSVQATFTPPVTNYDLLISKAPEELAKTIVGWLADAAELCGENRQEFDFSKAEEYAVSWLKSPVEVTE